MSIHKPVPLILDGALYDILVGFTMMLPEHQASVTEEMLATSVARAMVGQIAQLASMEALFKVLEALGGPTNEDELRQRIDAAKDASGYKPPAKPEAAKTEGAQQ